MPVNLMLWLCVSPWCDTPWADPPQTSSWSGRWQQETDQTVWAVAGSSPGCEPPAGTSEHTASNPLSLFDEAWPIQRKPQAWFNGKTLKAHLRFTLQLKSLLWLYSYLMHTYIKHELILICCVLLLCLCASNDAVWSNPSATQFPLLTYIFTDESESVIRIREAVKRRRSLYGSKSVSTHIGI